MDIVVIAHFVTEFAKEGTSRFVYLAEHLSERHDVELITSQFDHLKKAQREVREYGLRTKVTQLTEAGYPKNVCLRRFTSHAGFGRAVARYLEQRKKPDVIYCAVPSLDCAYAAAAYAKKHGIRFIVDVQDLWPEAFQMVFNLPVVSDVIFAPMKRRADFIYSCADAIVGVSKTYCDRAKKVNKKDIPSLPVFLGTKLARFDEYAANRPSRQGNEEFLLCYCGTLGHSYDLKCALDAMELLRERGCHSLGFHVLGDGPLKEEFERYALQRKLNVTFFGRVPYAEMCAELAACDVCMNVITKGAAGSIINKHGDYAASGLPVINTQENPEYRALVEEFGCGINCECANANDVADAIAHLMEHPEERARMGRNARKLAELKFDREVSYQKIYDIVEGKG